MLYDAGYAGTSVVDPTFSKKLKFKSIEKIFEAVSRSNSDSVGYSQRKDVSLLIKREDFVTLLLKVDTSPLTYTDAYNILEQFKLDPKKQIEVDKLHLTTEGNGAVFDYSTSVVFEYPTSD